MPKRSNEFQKLVLRIYNQLKGAGGKVTESAMLKEHSSDTEREVDILLEQKAFGTVVRIGIECRSQSRRNDVEWIDSLIGKYDDLTVDKVIAVSSSGFSKAAKRKAGAKKIETLHLQEALTTDWPAEFCRVGLRLVTRFDKPTRVILNISSPIDFEVAGLTPVFDADGNELGFAGAIPHYYYQRLNQRLEEFLADVVPKVYRRRPDFDKPLHWHFGTPIEPACHLKCESGTLIPLHSIRVEMLSTFELREMHLKHFALGDSQVSMAEIEVPEGKITFDVVQQVGEPISVYVNTPNGLTADQK